MISVFYSCYRVTIRMSTTFQSAFYNSSYWSHLFVAHELNTELHASSFYCIINFITSVKEVVFFIRQQDQKVMKFTEVVALKIRNNEFKLSECLLTSSVMLCILCLSLINLLTNSNICAILLAVSCQEDVNISTAVVSHFLH